MDYIKIAASDATQMIERTFVALHTSAPYQEYDTGGKVRRTLDGVDVTRGRALANISYMLRVKAIDNEVRETGVLPGTLSDLKTIYGMTKNATFTLTTNDGVAMNVVPFGKMQVVSITPAVSGTDAIFNVNVKFLEVPS